jgi:hypothetical protein
MESGSVGRGIHQARVNIPPRKAKAATALARRLRGNTSTQHHVTFKVTQTRWRGGTLLAQRMDASTYTFGGVDDNYKELCRAEASRALSYPQRAESADLEQRVFYNLVWWWAKPVDPSLERNFICEICRVPSHRLCIGMRTYCPESSRTRTGKEDDTGVAMRRE